MKSILTALILFITSTLFAVNYYSSGNNTFGGSGFPNPIQVGDTVFINNSDIITITDDIDINGVLMINTNATLDGEKKIKIHVGGYLYNDGIIDITEAIHNDGHFFNTNIANIKELHSDGYICNSGIIKLEPYETFKHHGGELECCGTILADDIEVHDNSSVSLNGNPVALTECQNFCNVNNDGNPVFINDVNEYAFLNNTSPSNSLINTEFVTICSASMLPIELIEFDGYDEAEVNKIFWTTASEINNDYFLLEKSENGMDWEELGRVEGSGNSSSVIEYNFTDTKPNISYTYYRLTQVDFNGKSEVFDIISVENRSTVFYTYRQNGQNAIYFSSPYNYILYNAMGQIITSGFDDSINLDELSKGVYILKIGLHTEKIMVR